MGISMALFMALRKGPLQMTAVVLFRPQKSVVRRALALGIPVFLERACFSCGQLIVTHMVAGLGNIALAADMLRIVAISESLYGLSIVLGDVLRGAGDSRTPFLIVLMGVWAVRLPLGPCSGERRSACRRGHLPHRRR